MLSLCLNCPEENKYFVEFSHTLLSPIHFSKVAARLKSCPDTNRSSSFNGVHRFSNSSGVLNKILMVLGTLVSCSPKQASPLLGAQRYHLKNRSSLGYDSN